MSGLNALFRKRIGIPEDEQITFEHLDTVLEKTAKNIPFENFCIIGNKTSEITRESLVNKMLVKKKAAFVTSSIRFCTSFCLKMALMQSWPAELFTKTRRESTRRLEERM